MEEELKQEIRQIAENQAEAKVALCRADANDVARQNEVLYDLRLETVRQAAELVRAEPDENELRDLAQALPAYDIASLYQTRASLLSLGSAVVVGWLLGGFLATVLGLFKLGGDILRPCAIFACLWGEEYFSVNPRARRIALAALGLGGLGRLAAALAAGAVRIASFGSIRQLIFGALPRPNIFKCLWLWAGAIFLCIFFARRETSLNFPALKQSLVRQIEERLRFCALVLSELAKLRKEAATATDAAAGANGRCPRQDCELAQAALSLLDTLDADKSAWLAGILARVGYEPKEGGRIIWDSAIHAGLYEPLGLIRDGDECLVLKRPYLVNGRVTRGQAQRLPVGAKP